MTERYRVKRTGGEGVKFVGVVKEDGGKSVSAVSARISSDPRDLVSIGYHKTKLGIGTTELDHCDMLDGGFCHFEGIESRVGKKFLKTDSEQTRFLTGALRREARREARRERAQASEE